MIRVYPTQDISLISGLLFTDKVCGFQPGAHINLKDGTIIDIDMQNEVVKALIMSILTHDFSELAGNTFVELFSKLFDDKLVVTH